MKRAVVSAIACAAALGCSATQSDAPRGGLFAESWRSGADAGEPRFQVQAIDASTYAIRQSIRTTFEAPFVYLLIGRDRALLIDTGTGGGGLRAEVDALIDAWARTNGASAPELVVVHSHAHSDHVSGDAEFADRPHTVVVGHTQPEVAAFFSLRNWPGGTASLELGDRSVDILPMPGHHASHIAVYDGQTRILFTGDAVYPGVLRYPCANASEYLASIERSLEFAARNEVSWMLGGHIEMRSAPRAFYQAPVEMRGDERPLELAPSVLGDIAAAMRSQTAYPRVEPFADFVLFPYPVNYATLSPPDWCARDR